MKAAVVPSVGARWEVKEVPTPEHSANQVLIKVHASGLCYSDVDIAEGKFPTRIEFPRSIDDEPAREIAVVGEGVGCKVSLLY